MIRTLLLTLWCCSIFAAEESLRVRIPYEDRQGTPAIETEANIRSEDRIQPLPESKKQTISAAYPDHQKDYKWVPGWILKGTGQLRVSDASAVSDGSLIAFLETTGKADGPQGGRIVLLDVPRKRICGYFEIGRKLSALRLGNTLTHAVAWAEEQKNLNQKAGFSVLNLKTGTETAFLPAEKPYSFAVAGTRLFAAGTAGKIQMYDLNGNGNKELLSGPHPFLGVTPDGKTVIAAADDAFYYFDAVSGETLRKEPLPSPLRICALTCMTPDGNSFIFASAPDSHGRHRVFFRVNGKQKEAADDSTGKFVWQERDSLFFLMRIIKGRIYRIDAETLKPFSYCEPKTVRPGTLGTVRFLFTGNEPGELIAMDTLGAVYSLKSVGKRWRKTMIVDAGTR